MVMNNLQEYVDQCVADLAGPNSFKARHSLVEAGPAALPLVVEAFHASQDPHIKLSLVELISEYRSDDAIPFLQQTLQDKSTVIWKAALDGLVILGTAEALHALHLSRASAPDAQRWLIDEAIQQINEGLE